jgi:hypothetical protein
MASCPLTIARVQFNEFPSYVLFDLTSDVFLPPGPCKFNHYEEAKHFLGYLLTKHPAWKLEDLGSIRQAWVGTYFKSYEGMMVDLAEFNFEKLGYLEPPFVHQIEAARKTMGTLLEETPY